MNYLYYGDNLDVLRESIDTESVDLVYLDPPFNSNRSYNVLFADRSGQESQAQIEAFDDTWTWAHDSEAAFNELVQGGAPPRVADAIDAMRRLLGDNDVLAYLVMMTQRLVELDRTLKPTGSIYLHCDPTASHYLKVVLDAVFGPEAFGNEIVWKRTSGHSDARRFGRVHDILLYYRKGSRATWNQAFQPYDEAYVEQYYRYRDDDGRRFMSADLSAAGLSGGGYIYEWRGITREWRCPIETMERYEAEGRIFYTRNGMPRLKRYLDESRGIPAQDLWLDIEAVRSWHPERLGYPTQKPEALLERVIGASSNEGDVVLDPFCGCGTTIAVAQRLRRSWIGIDVTFLAIDLIDKRLRNTYGEEAHDTYEKRGIPRDIEGAQALFDANPFDFERWAVSFVDGQANERAEQSGDRGVDGWVRFQATAREFGRAVVSVKGGRQLNPAMVRDLRGTVESQRADLGLLITLTEPTRGMRDEVRRSGSYTHPLTNRTYPRLQIITIAELLQGQKPDMPAAILPYVQARRGTMTQQGTLDV